MEICKNKLSCHILNHLRDSSEVNRTGVSHKFGANTLHSLVERGVKTEDPFFMFAVERVINSKKTFKLISHFEPFFFQDIFWGANTSQMV